MKVAIITCHRTYNYGAVLQAYALQQFLVSRGHIVEIIDYYPQYVKCHDNSLKGLPKRFIKLPDISRCKKTFGKFLNEKLILTSKTYETFDKLKNANFEFDMFITGSDQVWNMNMHNGMDDSYFLSFAPPKAKRISYAASIAMDSITEEQQNRFKTMLDDYFAVSVREQSGADLLRSIGISSEVVCDPVYLLDSNTWSNTERKMDINEKYILIYAFYQQKEIFEKAHEIAKDKGYKVYSVGASYLNAFMNVDKYFWAVSPEEFIWLINNAEMVLTNSFHGLSFSLILNVPVLSYRTKTQGNSRIIDLLKKIDIRFENKGNLLAEVTDYSVIQNKLSEYRTQSIEYLKGCNL